MKNISNYGIEDRWETEEGLFTFFPGTKWSGCRVYLNCSIETDKFEAFKMVEKEMDKYIKPLEKDTEERGYPVFKTYYEFGISSETPLIVYCKTVK